MSFKQLYVSHFRETTAVHADWLHKWQFARFLFVLRGTKSQKIKWHFLFARTFNSSGKPKYSYNGVDEVDKVVVSTATCYACDEIPRVNQSS